MTVTSTKPPFVRSLMGRVAAVDGSGCDDAERLELITVMEELKAALCAAQARVTVAFADSQHAAAQAYSARPARGAAGRPVADSAAGSEPADVYGASGRVGVAYDLAAVARSVGSQVALARREPPSRGDRLVGLARALVTELPRTMDALTCGRTSEWRATLVTRETATLSREDRAVADARLASVLPDLGDRAVERAARRLAEELDAASVVARRSRAVASRRVTCRPAPDGMAFLSVLGPLVDVVGAYASLTRYAQAVTTGTAPPPDDGSAVDEPGGRGVGQVMADAALRWLSGRQVGQAQPLEVNLVMTDSSMVGRTPWHGRAADSTTAASSWPSGRFEEPARIPGHGSLPAAAARALIRAERPGRDGPVGVVPERNGPLSSHAAAGICDDAESAESGQTARRQAEVWVRRLFTSPDGRDLVAMDSRRRAFSGQMRRLLVLRDDVCRTPWCEAPIRDADHTVAYSTGGETSAANGAGLCRRCNLTKELPGWSARVVSSGLLNDRAQDLDRDRGQAREPVALADPEPAPSPHTIEIRTPTGHTYRSLAPPLLGWGSIAPVPASGQMEVLREEKSLDASTADPLAPTG